MLNRDFDCLTVNGVCDLSEKNIIAGSPLTLGANGYRLAKEGDTFVGLSFNYYHTGKNDVTGGEWFTDSGKVGVVKIAQCTLEADEIDGVKVSPFVLPTSESGVSYAVGTMLAVNADGQLEPTTEADKKVATVVFFDEQAGTLKVFVNAQN